MALQLQTRMPLADQVQRNLERSYPWLLVGFLYHEQRAEKGKNGTSNKPFTFHLPWLCTAPMFLKSSPELNELEEKGRHCSLAPFLLAFYTTLTNTEALALSDLCIHGSCFMLLMEFCQFSADCPNQSIPAFLYNQQPAGVEETVKDTLALALSFCHLYNQR